VNLVFILFILAVGVIFRSPLRKGARLLASQFSLTQGKMRVVKRTLKLLAVLVIAGVCFYFIQTDLRVSGEFRILPIHNADVRAEVEGIIEEILVEEGKTVGINTVVGRISDGATAASTAPVPAPAAADGGRVVHRMLGLPCLTRRTCRVAVAKLIWSERRSTSFARCAFTAFC